MGFRAYLAKQLFKDCIVLPKAAGKGIQVDPDNPSYTWRDKEGIIIPDPGGANAPTLTVFRGGKCRAYAYTLNDYMDMIYHIPHDWVPGTDIFIHPHWFHNGTDISGTLSYTFSYTYAKGHNQVGGEYGVEKAQAFTFSSLTIGAYPRWRHRVDEFQLTNAGGTGNLLDTANIEPDGIVHANVEVTGMPTITGGNLFCSTIDLHYLSYNIGTIQKAPNFYV